MKRFAVLALIFTCAVIGRPWVRAQVTPAAPAGSQSASTSAQSAPPTSPGVKDGLVGISCNIGLRYLAPPRLHHAFKLLVDGQNKQANALFQAEMDSARPDPIAFVGLVQARRDLWPEQVKQLQHQISIKRDVTIEFRLGVLLYYHWAEFRLRPKSPDYKEFDAASVLIKDVWKQTHLPLAGCFLVDMSPFLHEGWIPLDRRAILEQLIQIYAGTGLYHYYLNAKHSHWKDDPPRIDGIKPDNQLPLAAVLITLWRDYSGRGGKLVTVNNVQTIQVDPYSEDQTGAMRFLDGWIKNLDHKNHFLVAQVTQ